MTKKNRNIEPSKWQMVSVKMVELRFMLEEILDKNFSPEEKESDRYKELVKEFKEQLDHFFEMKNIPIYRRKWITIRNIILSILSASFGIIITNIDKIFELIGKLIFSK